MSAENVNGDSDLEITAANAAESDTPIIPSGVVENVASRDFITPQEQLAAGWDIFPLLPGVKAKYAHFRDDGTTEATHWVNGWERLTPEQVEQYWPSAGGGHNVGVATGRRSGVWVLDVDKVLEDEEDAREYVAEWTGILIPKTLSVRTASGKWHFYFAMPEGAGIEIRSSQGKPDGSSGLAPFIDVRGDGGMAMGIGSSVRDGDEVNYYRVVTFMKPVHAPLELVERVKKREVDPATITPASTEKNVDPIGDLTAKPWIEAELQRLRDLARPWVEGAGWDTTCFEVACQLAEFANSEWCSLTLEEAQRLFLEAAPRDSKWSPAPKWVQGVQTTLGQAKPLPIKATAHNIIDSAPAVATMIRQERGREIEVLAIEPPSRWVVTPSTDWSGTSRKKARRVIGAFIPKHHDTPLLMMVQEVWHYWTGSHWAVLPNREVEKFVSNVLDLAMEPPEPTKPGEAPSAPRATSTSKRSVLDLLDSGLAMELDRDVTPGQIMGGGVQGRVIGLANGVLAVRDDGQHEFVTASPLFFNLTASEYTYDPTATCDGWLAWLTETFEHDPKAVEALQEWFGAILLANPLLIQKMFWLIGPKRSGKGTIQGIARQMVGGAASVTLHNLASQFGKERLVGHSLAIIDDSRDPRRDEVNEAVQFLLAYTTGGLVQIDRKHMKAWSGILQQTLLAASNAAPRLADEGSAIASRMEVIQTRASHFGSEDPHLQAELAKELPGILNWALAGLARLVGNGYKFTQADAGDRVRQDVESSGTGAGAFVEQSIMAGGQVTNEDLRIAREVWTSLDSESGNPPTQPSIATAIRMAYPDAANNKTITSFEGKKTKGWRGISLRCRECETASPAVVVSKIHGPLCALHRPSVEVAA